MTDFKGGARDAKRARYGARVQKEMKQAFERKVQEMRDETSNSLQSMELNQMFSQDINFSHQLKFKNSIIGLQTHAQYSKKAKMHLNHENINNSIENEYEKIEQKLQNISDQQLLCNQNQMKKKRRKLINSSLLSFADDTEDTTDEESEDIINRKRACNSIIEADKKRRKIQKNPNVDTSFLPDAERDLNDKKLRLELEREWYSKQKQIKRERLEITYSYWDGSGHRRSIEVNKGLKIGEFLELVRKDLAPHFSELRGIIHGDSLLYIKDDLIIPHMYSFYDLIVSKAIGKSGLILFRNEIFDKGEYRIMGDGGHPGKVITRAWYERNKHIFPASRWEVYDPSLYTKI